MSHTETFMQPDLYNFHYYYQKRVAAKSANTKIICIKNTSPKFQKNNSFINVDEQAVRG